MKFLQYITFFFLSFILFAWGAFCSQKIEPKNENNGIKKEITTSSVKTPQKTSTGGKSDTEEIDSAIIDSVKTDAEKNIKELDSSLKELYWEDLEQLLEAYKRIKKTLLNQKRKAVSKDMSESNRKIWDSYLDYMIFLIDKRIDTIENWKKETKKTIIDSIVSLFSDDNQNQNKDKKGE